MKPRGTLPFRYLLFNKPYGVLSQFTAGTTGAGDRKTLADHIPVAGVYPVGRLDLDSEGLLLLTDDGEFQHRLSDPRFAHTRTYWVQVEGIVTPGAVEQLRSGVCIQGYQTRPAQVAAMSEASLPARVPPIRYRANIPTSWLHLTLTEGRNRQVRRMTAAVGLPTLRLFRAAIGRLTTGSLAPGAWRYLVPEDLLALGYRAGFDAGEATAIMANKRRSCAGRRRTTAAFTGANRRH